MRQAIVTKYLGPTDFLGARVKASAQAGSVVVFWKGALEQAHRVGLLDELREECLDARSVDDVCAAARDWAIDLGIKEV